MRSTERLRLLENEMMRLADEALRGYFADVPAPNKFWQPRVDVHETAEFVVVKAELAGIDPDSLQVTLSADRRALIIAGERHEDKDEREGRIRCYQLEIFFGPFEREVPLPPGTKVDVDGLNASYKDGILTVDLAKINPVASETESISIHVSSTATITN
jgi:HSP20 family protein